MKRNLLVLGSAIVALLTLAVIISCEKAIFDSEETKDEPNGNLRVSVFQIENTPFASLMRGGSWNVPDGDGTTTRAAQAASEILTRLNFAVYHLDGSRVKQVNQTAGDKNFGTCSFQLDEGDYQLVAVGHSASGNPTMTNSAKIQFTNATGYTDTFMASLDVTIGEEPVDVDFTLDRIVALCRFVLTDESFPAEVKKMQFYYTGGSGAFDASTGLGSVNSKQTVTFDVSNGQKQFDLYTFLHEESDNIALKVSALDANGNALYERDFDVPMQTNHITWLTGAFFDGTGGSSSSGGVTVIGVNTDWAGETHLTF